jgi:hypothetical protein
VSLPGKVCSQFSGIFAGADKLWTEVNADNQESYVILLGNKNMIGI